MEEQYRGRSSSGTKLGATSCVGRPAPFPLPCNMGGKTPKMMFAFPPCPPSKLMRHTPTIPLSSQQHPPFSSLKGIKGGIWRGDTVTVADISIFFRQKPQRDPASKRHSLSFNSERGNNKNRLCSKTCGINKILLSRKSNKRAHDPFPKRIYEVKIKEKT